MEFKEWLEEFKVKFEEQSGYPLFLDEIAEERYELEYWAMGVPPGDAVAEEMSVGL